VDPIYSSEVHMTLACLKCGKNWELDLHSNGPGGVLGRWLLRQMSVVSNGN